MLHDSPMLSLQEIQHIARLARLELTGEEQETFGGQLSSVLEYVAKLQELDTEGVSELAHAAGLQNVFREDKAETVVPLIREAIINAFPRKSADLLGVPAVFEGRTE